MHPGGLRAQLRVGVWLKAHGLLPCSYQGGESGRPCRIGQSLALRKHCLFRLQHSHPHLRLHKALGAHSWLLAFCHLPALLPAPSHSQVPLTGPRTCFRASVHLSPVPERLCPDGHLVPSLSRPQLTVTLSERPDLTGQQPPTQPVTLPGALSGESVTCLLHLLSVSLQTE